MTDSPFKNIPGFGLSPTEQAILDAITESASKFTPIFEAIKTSFPETFETPDPDLGKTAEGTGSTSNSANFLGERTVLDEALRVYHFPNGEVRIANPRELIVRPSGTHRITDDTGLLHVINTGWLSISIDNKGASWDV